MSEIITDKLTGKTSAGDVTITSEGGSATMQLQQGLAKAWVNFDGTGTIASRDSLNVSSLTDNASGDYDINFTNSMSNSNYCTTGSCAYKSGLGQPNFGHDFNDATKSTSAENILVVYAQSVTDTTFAEVAILGDLA